MTDYPRTESGLAAALAAATGDPTRLWHDGDVIRVMPPQAPPVPGKVTRRQFKQGLTRLGIRAGVEAWRASLDTSTQAGETLVTATYPVPEAQLAAAPDAALTVKFAARPGSSTAQILDVRLVRAPQP